MGDAEDQTAGMGEAPSPVAAGAEKATATAARVAAPQGELLEEGAKAPAADKAAPAAAQEAKPAPVAETKKAESPKPTNAAEYLVHWASVCAAATSATALQNQFAAERNLRNSCKPFDEDQFAEMTRLKDDRIAELKK